MAGNRETHTRARGPAGSTSAKYAPRARRGKGSTGHNLKRRERRQSAPGAAWFASGCRPPLPQTLTHRTGVSRDSGPRRNYLQNSRSNDIHGARARATRITGGVWPGPGMNSYRAVTQPQRGFRGNRTQKADNGAQTGGAGSTRPYCAQPRRRLGAACVTARTAAERTTEAGRESLDGQRVAGGRQARHMRGSTTRVTYPIVAATARRASCLTARVSQRVETGCVRACAPYPTFRSCLAEEKKKKTSAVSRKKNE